MSTERRERLPGGVWAAAVGAVVLLLATAARYGLHRDELYFIVAGRRLDWGFVDQPPLVPLIARIVDTVAGPSPVALRLLPALAIGSVAVLAALIARHFGGGRTAQVAAAVAASWSGVALAIGHLLSTVTFEYLLWTVVVLLVVRIIDGADPRWWLAVGATVGVGMLNKHLIAVFALGLLVALLGVGPREVLRSRWPWLGAGFAALLALPNVLWQAANDWPQLEMAGALAERSDGPIAFVLQQIGLLSIALAVPAAAGLWRLLRSPAMRRWRVIGVTFVLLYSAFLVTGGKAYYVAPLYPALLAAGAVWFEGLRPTRRRVMTGAAAVGIAAGLVIALPLVPESALTTVDATGELSETVGWPELIDQVVDVYEMVPADQRDSVAIFTGSYGEAGAVDVLGAERGLPAATSGHNTYWLWGPPPNHGPVIGVGGIGDRLAAICPGVEQVGTITNPWDVANEEYGLPLYLCLEPTGQLADIWDEVRHYN